jgi:hypothetical protein
MQKSAIIGYSGFVGSTLCNQFKFTDFYNSKNTSSLANRHYDFVVCAAAPGEKWKANQYPDMDLANIKSLASNLKSMNANLFILISTIDVYSNPTDVNEDSKTTDDKLIPYGKNRLFLENFIRNNFSKYLIVRLCALFGKGLKKNFVFDLINNNQDYLPNPKSEFQFYPMSNLWKDIQQALNNSLTLVNFVSEPISAQEITLYTFNAKLPPRTKTKPKLYDVRTKYADLFNKTGNYIYRKKDILPKLKTFILEEKNSRPTFSKLNRDQNG